MTKYKLEITPKNGASLDKILSKLFGLLGKNGMAKNMSMDQVPGKKDLIVVFESDADRAILMEQIGYITDIAQTAHLS